MHELSIAMSLLDVVAEELERQGGGQVVAIHLKIGPLSGVVKEALSSAFELVREGTEMDRAELLVEDVPIVAFCGLCCGLRSIISAIEIACPDCGQPTPDIIHGRELELVGVEIVES